jgi:hypothetical protein
VRVKGGKLVRRWGKNGEKGKNSDLKGSREKPNMHAIERTGCVRSHLCLVYVREGGYALERIVCV